MAEGSGLGMLRQRRLPSQNFMQFFCRASIFDALPRGRGGAVAFVLRMNPADPKTLNPKP